jgi:hypothetical protein
MIRLKCHCGYKHSRNVDEKDKVDCPNPNCNNDGIWSDGSIDGFVIIKK